MQETPIVVNSRSSSDKKSLMDHISVHFYNAKHRFNADISSPRNAALNVIYNKTINDLWKYVSVENIKYIHTVTQFSIITDYG